VGVGFGVGGWGSLVCCFLDVLVDFMFIGGGCVVG